MLRASKLLVDGAVWFGDGMTSLNNGKSGRGSPPLRKEVRLSKHKEKFVMGKERTQWSACQWTSVPREAIGKAIFSEWELARLGELESGHGLKKICGNRDAGGSPMTCQSEVASVSSCSVKLWYIFWVSICQCVLNAPPGGLAEGKIFLFPEKLTELWLSFDIKFRWTEQIARCSLLSSIHLIKSS